MNINAGFKEIWNTKVETVRKSLFYKKVSNPPLEKIQRDNKKPAKNEISINGNWRIGIEGNITSGGPVFIGISDMKLLLKFNFNVELQEKTSYKTSPQIIFSLKKADKLEYPYQRKFKLKVTDSKVLIEAESEESLLRASLYLSNYWRLRRNLYLKKGKRIINPSIPVHIGGDLWGGFTTTHEWIPGRENDSNFIELTRMGINYLNIMMLLEELITDADVKKYPEFSSLVNPDASDNRSKLAMLAKCAALYDISIMLMAYNPKLTITHKVFSDYPECTGATQKLPYANFRVLCTSDNKTRSFIADTWASLFKEIPELGGILMICGGEGFQHCYMRSTAERNIPKSENLNMDVSEYGKDSIYDMDLKIHPLNSAGDCPRCSKRTGDAVAAELVNAVAEKVKEVRNSIICVSWLYSAGSYWSTSLDQNEFINKIAKKRNKTDIILQTEVDKDHAEWRNAGYAKKAWDYSLSLTSFSKRCKNQRKLCKRHGIKFSAKLEINMSIECVTPPYLPVFEIQKKHWEFAKLLKPFAVQSRWIFDGSCKSHSEEMGFWTIWGGRGEYSDTDKVLDAITARDYGEENIKHMRTAWRKMSDAMIHHPSLDYYLGSYFMGPCQPLLLDPDDIQKLDKSFFGYFYWQLQEASADTKNMQTSPKPLFYTNPAFEVKARRGSNRGKEVGLDELKKMTSLWKSGVIEMEKVKKQVPSHLKEKFQEMYVLSKFLEYNWSSATNVEEFLRLRNEIIENSRSHFERWEHRRINLACLKKMEIIAREELEIAHKALALVSGVDFLNLELRLDIGCCSTEKILNAKIKQITDLLKIKLPQMKKFLSCINLLSD